MADASNTAIADSSQPVTCMRGAAVALMTLQAVAFAVESALVRWSGEATNMMTLSSARSLGGLVLVAILSRGHLLWRTNVPGLMSARCLVSALSLWIMILTYRAMPLSDATAISFLMGPLLVLYSTVFLGEAALVPVRIISIPREPDDRAIREPKCRRRNAQPSGSPVSLASRLRKTLLELASL